MNLTCSGLTDLTIASSDVVVPTEVEAAALVKKLISYFQGPLHEVKYTNEPKKLRTIMPRSRVRAYDVRRIIDVIADDDSFVELGAGWGKSVVTGLMRLKVSMRSATCFIRLTTDANCVRIDRVSQLAS